MIDFSGKTYRNILNEQLARIPDTLDKREGSVIQTALGPEAWYLEGAYLDLDRVQKNAHADTAGGEDLDRICAERNVVRKRATHAVKKGIFNVPVPLGTRFGTVNRESYLVYKVTGTTAEINTYNLTCETAGQVGNSYSGQLLSVDYVSGLAKAELLSTVEAGTEEEDDEALRKRYYASFDVSAFGGNIAAYRNEIMGIDGVGAVQVYPAWMGGGTVLCSILDGNLTPAGPGLIDKVQNIICPSDEDGDSPSADGYGFAPIGAVVTIRTGTRIMINISCNIQFKTGVNAQAHMDDVRNILEDYIKEVRNSWGERLKSRKIKYSVVIYIARIVAAIFKIPDVVNVTNVTINGMPNDYELIESPEEQQVPILGEVVINGG